MSNAPELTLREFHQMEELLAAYGPEEERDTAAASFTEDHVSASLAGSSQAPREEEPERRPRAAGLLSGLPKPRKPGKQFAAAVEASDAVPAPDVGTEQSGLSSLLPPPKHGSAAQPSLHTNAGCDDDNRDKKVEDLETELLKRRAESEHASAPSSADLDEHARPHAEHADPAPRPAHEFYDTPVGPTAPHPASAFAVGQSGEWLAPPPVLEEPKQERLSAPGAQKQNKRKRELDDVSITEISREELKEGQERARAAHMGKAKAYGSEYLDKLKKQADSGPGGRAKAKHQISAIYAETKRAELDVIEGKKAGPSGRRPSHAKYGW